MVDVLLTIHKAPQCGAPTPPRHCRRVYKGKQETLLLLPLVVSKQKYLETSALVSRWAHANSVPELLRGVKTVYHSTAVKELSIALTMSPGMVS